MALPRLIYWGAKIVAHPEVSQIFIDEIYPGRISIQKSLIKVAIYEIYGMKWGVSPPNLRLGGPWPPGPLRDV